MKRSDKRVASKFFHAADSFGMRLAAKMISPLMLRNYHIRQAATHSG
jgi:hypothetical protein